MPPFADPTYCGTETTILTSPALLFILWHMRKTTTALFSLALLASCKSDATPDEQSKNTKVDLNPVVIETPPATLKVHSSGLDRYKDTGVYLDGVPMAVLKFGELPVPLTPVWMEEKAAIPFKASDNGPRFKIVKERRYRFRDYFEGLGIDVSKIKEMHLYGGNQHAAAVIISGDKLRSSDDFLFRFGGSIWGKPLPSCPENMGDGKCPDQLSSVTLYAEKTPPTRKAGHFYFGEELIKGIPYFGEAIRGGVRIYFDGPLAATIKRNKLQASKLKPVGDPKLNQYSLVAFLKSQNVDTNSIQEAWLIAYERRIKKLSRAELLKATFRAGEAGSGEILVGEASTATHAISLHTKAVRAEDLPVLTPEELDKSDG